MQCRTCGSIQDADAAFCIQCGNSLATETLPNKRIARRPYLFALLLLPVLLAAGAAGYYKFMLPDGTAAVVNGEKIMLSELDAAVNRVWSGRVADRTGEAERAAPGRLRYQVLNRLIIERIALQAARGAGMTATNDEVSQIILGMQQVSGLEEREFDRSVEKQFGSLRAFRKKVEQDRLIAKFLSERVVLKGTDTQQAQALVDDWFRRSSRTASVRIALAEQVSSAGCSCCSKGAATRPGANETNASAGGLRREAAAAGIRYWQQRYGGGGVTAKTADLGCHVQVDIVQADKTVLSLRYQNGVISEER